MAAAGESQHPNSGEALEFLCRSYWQPLYLFIRRNGYTIEDARDLTQAFFAHILDRKSVAAADPGRGRFRTFLLASLKHFLAHQRDRSQAQKRGGRHEIISLDQFDPEESAALGVARESTPDLSFDKRWALRQIENALVRLRADYAASGRTALYDLLKDYVWGERNALSLSEIAGQLDLTEEAVKKAVQRLRHRFREHLRAEVAQTVSTPDQIDEEMSHLRSALSS